MLVTLSAVFLLCLVSCFCHFICLFVLLFLELWFNITSMIMGGQLDGLLSHWQPAFANKLLILDFDFFLNFKPIWDWHTDSRTNERARSRKTLMPVLRHSVIGWWTTRRWLNIISCVSSGGVLSASTFTITITMLVFSAPLYTKPDREALQQS